MSKRAKITIILGILTALMPIIGLPGKIESIIVILLGIAIAGFMYFAEKRVSTCKDCNDKKSEAFQENTEDELSSQNINSKQETQEKNKNQNKGSEYNNHELEQEPITMKIKKE